MSAWLSSLKRLTLDAWADIGTIVSGIASVISLVAIIVGLFIAKAQLESWKIEAVQVRRRDTAENFLAALAGVERALTEFLQQKNSADLALSLASFSSQESPESFMMESKVRILQDRTIPVDSLIDNLTAHTLRLSIHDEAGCADGALAELTAAWQDLKVRLRDLQLMLILERVSGTEWTYDKETRDAGYRQDWNSIPSRLGDDSNEISKRLGDAVSSLRHSGLAATRIR